MFQPPIIVISGPSGAGKDTLVRSYLARNLGTYIAKSHTTRPPRAGEKDGEDYYFVSPEEFQTLLDDKEFVEHVSVHGNSYGATKSEFEATDGEKVILFIADPVGASKIKERYPDRTKTVFLLPNTYTELITRLIERGESHENIVSRLEECQNWFSLAYMYDYVIVNGNGGLVNAREDLYSIIHTATKHNPSTKDDYIKRLIEEFPTEEAR